MSELSATWTEELLEVTSAFSRARTAREVGEVAVAVGVKAFGANAGWLYVVTRDGEQLEMVAWAGLDAEERSRNSRLPRSHPGPSAAVARSGQPAFLERREDVDGRFGDLAAYLHATGGSRIVLPLLVGDRPVGCLAIRLATWGAISGAQRAFALALASQCSQALDRARLLDAEQHARRRLKILADAAEAFSGPELSLSAVLDIVTRKVAGATGDGCLVRLVSSDGSCLEPRAFHAANPDAREALAKGLATDRERLTDGWNPQVVGRGETVLVPVVDPAALERTVRPGLRAWLDRYPVRSLIIAPMALKGRVIGSLAVVRWREHDPYGDEDRLLVEGLAARAAGAIEKTRLYEEVLRSQRLFEGIADASPDMLYLFDVKRGRSVYVSRAVERVLGYTPREMAALGGGFIARLVHPDDRARLEAENRRFALLADGELVEHAYRMRHADGSWRWVRSRDRIFSRGPAGDPELILGVTRDVTEHVRAESERDELLKREQQARREAETASRAKDEFLAMLGHELRNPLSPILTALELMRRRDPDALARERTLIERQVHHVVRLVDDLLDVSRITRGKVQLRRQPVEVHEVVTAAIEMASPLLEAQRHTLDVDVPRRGLLVDGDSERLAQVVSNLLTNAAKYTKPGGHIDLKAAREGEEVVVRVRDSGIGIAPELLPRVFDLFVQSERALDRSQGGLGLGLPIVKTLTEMHGGRVLAESEGHGHGSTFVIRLPALAGPSVTPVPSAGAAPRHRRRPGQGHRVLVVDDNQDAADALVEALGAAGHQALAAYDGPSALDAAARVQPEAAFLDIGLPVMDGYELARRLRELLGPGVKLVAVTGYGQDRDRALSREAGFDEHLVKPVDLAFLEKVLDDLMTSREGAGASA
jgi:PAS domain S-box-containing protein